MSKPIFCVTHPRACSTAFERVFMTRTEDLKCVHEPFGDAFYFGPERMGTRYEGDEPARASSGFAESTYQTIFDRLDREASEGKRLFIKDIIHYLLPPDSAPAEIAPSLHIKRRGVGTNTNGATNGVKNGVVNGTSTKAPFPYGTGVEPGNPTVVPDEMLRQFHFTFLIRDPHSSIPSYFRCTIPPLDDVTGFHEFYPSEAGYDEVRRIFDYLVASGHVGPEMAGKGGSVTNGHNHTNGSNGINGHHEKAEICLVDADDLLDNPYAIVEAYCKSVGLDFKEEMLTWDNEEDHTRAKEAFEKWRGFHDDAINSKDLRPRKHGKKQKSEEEWDAEWKAKYGDQGARLIRETVDKTMPDYLYLKQFAMKV